MRKRIILFLQTAIWYLEGDNARRYYKYEWQTFWTFTFPRMVRDFKVKYLGYRTFAMEHQFSVIDSVVRFDSENILTEANRQLKEERHRFGLKKAQLGVQAWMNRHSPTGRVNGGVGKMGDLEVECSQQSEVKLTREERSHAGKLYNMMSFGRRG